MDEIDLLDAWVMWRQRQANLFNILIEEVTPVPWDTTETIEGFMDNPAVPRVYAWASNMWIHNNYLIIGKGDIAEELFHYP